MAAEHVTAGEFGRTLTRVFEQLDRIEAQGQITNGRVTKLEANQEAAGKLSVKMSTGVSVIVTAVINGVFAAIGGAK